MSGARADSRENLHDLAAPLLGSSPRHGDQHEDCMHGGSSAEGRGGSRGWLAEQLRGGGGAGSGGGGHHAAFRESPDIGGGGVLLPAGYQQLPKLSARTMQRHPSMPSSRARCGRGGGDGLCPVAAARTACRCCRSLLARRHCVPSLARRRSAWIVLDDQAKRSFLHADKRSLIVQVRPPS